MTIYSVSRKKEKIICSLLSVSVIFSFGVNDRETRHQFSLKIKKDVKKYFSLSDYVNGERKYHVEEKY